MEASDVFVKVEISVNQRGKTTITWDLNDKFAQYGPYLFYVEYSRYEEAPEDEWEDVTTEPVLNSFGFDIDEHSRRHAMENNSVYRVKLVTPYGTFYSPVQRAFGILPKEVFYLWKDIVRKEGLIIHARRGATPGLLLKRRRYGPKCVDCIDKNTGQVVDPHCELCFGTGILGGYFAPEDYPVLFSVGDKKDSQITKAGTVQPNDKVGRCLIYPFPESKDVWYEAATGKAYVIRRVEIAAQFQAQPTAVIAEFKQAPATDPIYFVLT